MKTADIEVGKAYFVEIDYGSRGKAEVLEKAIVIGRPGQQTKSGVQVKLLQDIPRAFTAEPHREGAVFLVAARKVDHEWTEDDETAAAEAAALADQRVRVAEALKARGLDESLATGVYMRGGSVTLPLDAMEQLLGIGMWEGVGDAHA